jgi:hypothetical protein
MKRCGLIMENKASNYLHDICKTIGCSGLNKDCPGNPDCEILQKVIGKIYNAVCPFCGVERYNAYIANNYGHRIQCNANIT